METPYKSALYFHLPRKLNLKDSRNFRFCTDYGGIYLLNKEGSIVLQTKPACSFMSPSMSHWTIIALSDGFKKHNLGPEEEILIQSCQGYGLNDPSDIIVGRLLTLPASKTQEYSPKEMFSQTMKAIIEETLNKIECSSNIVRKDLYYEKLPLEELFKLLNIKEYSK